jgi:dolichol-phosphate mannosyltransferase
MKKILNKTKQIIYYIKLRKVVIGKFIIVSGSAVVINLLLLFLFVNYLGFKTSLKQNVANVISMEISIVYNYILSRSITWKNRHQETGSKLLQQILKFHVTIGITILFRLGLFALLQVFGVHYIINAAIGIALASVFNFIVYDALIFKKKEE